MSGKQIRKNLFLRDSDFILKMTSIVVVGVLIPFLLGRFSTQFNLPDQLILGFLVAISLSFVELIASVRRLLSNDDQQMIIFRSKENVDRSLIEIQSDLGSLIVGQKDLFVEIYQSELDDLARRMSKTKSDLELPVLQDAEVTQMMLSPFQSHPGAIIRAVHYFTKNEFFNDVHSRHFFNRVNAEVASENIKEVRRLFIRTAPEDATADGSLRLMRFHYANRGYDFRVIDVADYMKLAHDHKIEGEPIDFGIYGDWFVYRSQASQGQDVRGSFFANPTEVSTYQRFFDACWNSNFILQDYQTEVASMKSMSIEELFNSIPPPVSGSGRKNLSSVDETN